MGEEGFEAQLDSDAAVYIFMEPLDQLVRQNTMFPPMRRHRSESLPHDVIELILKRLPVKPLGRFKSVCKKWKSTIESQSFKQGQLIRRMQSRGPDVLFLPLLDEVAGDAHSFQFGSSVAHTLRLPSSGTEIVPSSCDGLVCCYNTYAPSIPNVVVNPTTRWYQSFPLSTIQEFLVDLHKKKRLAHVPVPELGFGKDMIRGTYKAVWLINSSGFGLDNVTTCEVFDFSNNACGWRFLLPASPYRVIAFHKPVHVNGSLCWFTECDETKVLSLDLHTETFQVISKAPFPHATDHRSINMCVLDNRLCVSYRSCTTQVIWSLHSSSSTWKPMCSLDLTQNLSWFPLPPKFPVVSPIAIVDKNKLLVQGRDDLDPVAVHDLDTKSCDLLFMPIDCMTSVYYFESLLSVS